MNRPLFAVAVLIVAPEGIPVVRDLKKPVPLFWKLPGGRSEGNETAEATAVREVQEEIGLTLTEPDLKVIHQEQREHHTLVIFRADVAALGTLRTQGNDGEDVAVFSPQELLQNS